MHRTEVEDRERVTEWLYKVGDMVRRHVAEQKKACCYCGSEADKVEQCSLRCVCAWEAAHSLWKEKRADPSAHIDLSVEDLRYIQTGFEEAVEREPNELLLADYALFLWYEHGEHNTPEKLLEKAIALPTKDPMVRMRILNLYSHFLSSTPVTSAKLDAHRTKTMNHMELTNMELVMEIVD